MSKNDYIEKLQAMVDQMPDEDDAQDAEIIAARIRELAALLPIEYGQQREAAATELGVRVADLDKAVEQTRRVRGSDSEERKELFPEIVPCSDPVDGSNLLDEIASELRRYMVMPEEAVTAVALWALSTYTVEATQIAPILGIESPEKRCGKSTLMAILQAMVWRGFSTSNISMAAVYRVMDQYQPTLMIDEADASVDKNDAMRGILNAGHNRSASMTVRMGGEHFDQVEVFNSFGPKALAGIGSRAGTLADRSIIIPLQRRLAHERVERLRLDRLDYRDLQSRCAGWALQHLDELRHADPDVPDGLHDRAADNWRPLLAIADLCGSWADRARPAAVALSSVDDQEDAAAILLLEDIRALFAEKQEANCVKSSSLAFHLNTMHERPWPEWNRGKPITQRQIANLLRRFRVRPRTIRSAADQTAKGYRLEQFEDLFRRYLSEN